VFPVSCKAPHFDIVILILSRYLSIINKQLLNIGILLLFYFLSFQFRQIKKHSRFSGMLFSVSLFT